MKENLPDRFVSFVQGRLGSKKTEEVKEFLWQLGFSSEPRSSDKPHEPITEIPVFEATAPTEAPPATQFPTSA